MKPKNTRRRVVLDETQVWMCCGKYYGKKIKQCRVCGARASGSPTRHTNAKLESGKQVALDEKSKLKKKLPKVTGRLIITIERYGRRLDDDNFIGGAKQLRDAIAEALGKKGDGGKDGLEFRYLQYPAREKDRKTIIRIKQLTDDGKRGICDYQEGLNIKCHQRTKKA